MTMVFAMFSAALLVVTLGNMLTVASTDALISQNLVVTVQARHAAEGGLDLALAQLNEPSYASCPVCATVFTGVAVGNVATVSAVATGDMTRLTVVATGTTPGDRPAIASVQQDYVRDPVTGRWSMLPGTFRRN